MLRNSLWKKTHTIPNSYNHKRLTCRQAAPRTAARFPIPVLLNSPFAYHKPQSAAEPESCHLELHRDQGRSHLAAR